MESANLQLFTVAGRAALAGTGLGGTTPTWDNPSQRRMSPCVF